MTSNSTCHTIKNSLIISDVHMMDFHLLIGGHSNICRQLYLEIVILAVLTDDDSFFVHIISIKISSIRSFFNFAAFNNWKKGCILLLTRKREFQSKLWILYIYSSLLNLFYLRISQTPSSQSKLYPMSSETFLVLMCRTLAISNPHISLNSVPCLYVGLLTTSV